MGDVTDLDARYGRPSQRKRWLIIVGFTVGILGGIALAASIAWNDVQHHSADVFAFDVESEHLTSVELLIHRDKPVALTCRVYAQAEDKQIVGEKTVEVPSSTHAAVKVTIDITTQRRATTGALRSCDEH
jgi:hypothetical protein